MSSFGYYSIVINFVINLWSILLCVFPVHDDLRSLQFRYLMAGGIKKAILSVRDPLRAKP